MSEKADLLAKVYTHLAEALSATRGEDLPPWFSSRARDWPLYIPAAELADLETNSSFVPAVEAMAEVPSSSGSLRWSEGQHLFYSFEGQPLWLHESHYTDGHIPGPTTFAVKALYTQAGLQVSGAELPDHAAVELAFLAFLANKESTDPAQQDIWRAARRMFIKNHAGRWLPRLGQALINYPYPAWAVIGQILKASLRPAASRSPRTSLSYLLPFIPDIEQCNLCGFCIGVCPTRALGIREDEHSTSLWLKPLQCTYCRKCLNVCPRDALVFDGQHKDQEFAVLRESPRATCSCCGAPTVSEAELAAVAEQLGQPEWLNYCLKCRTQLVALT